MLEALQYTCQEKKDLKLITTHEKRDMENLIYFVQKRIKEESECTF